MHLKKRKTMSTLFCFFNAFLCAKFLSFESNHSKRVFFGKFLSQLLWPQLLHPSCDWCDAVHLKICPTHDKSFPKLNPDQLAMNVLFDNSCENMHFDQEAFVIVGFEKASCVLLLLLLLLLIMLSAACWSRIRDISSPLMVLTGLLNFENDDWQRRVNSKHDSTCQLAWNPFHNQQCLSVLLFPLVFQVFFFVAIAVMDTIVAMSVFPTSLTSIFKLLWTFDAQSLLSHLLSCSSPLFCSFACLQKWFHVTRKASAPQAWHLFSIASHWDVLCWICDHDFHQVLCLQESLICGPCKMQ